MEISLHCISFHSEWWRWWWWWSLLNVQNVQRIKSKLIWKLEWLKMAFPIVFVYCFAFAWSGVACGVAWLGWGWVVLFMAACSFHFAADATCFGLLTLFTLFMSWWDEMMCTNRSWNSIAEIQKTSKENTKWWMIIIIIRNETKRKMNVSLSFCVWNNNKMKWNEMKCFRRHWAIV